MGDGRSIFCKLGVQSFNSPDFLINEQGDILYEFSAGYQNDSEVLEIIVEDMNEDGLKDVEVVTYFSDMPDVYRFEWYFYQEEDGFFNFGLSKMLGV